MKGLPKPIVLTCLVMATIPLFASTPKGMMLYGDSVIVNGQKISMGSAAVFPNDIVQTGEGHANVAFVGATVGLDQGTVILMSPDSVRLDHGGLLVVDTQTPVAVHAGDVLVLPANPTPTQFQIKSQNGKLQIVAQKGDLLIKDCSGTTTLQEGQERTRDDSAHCGAGAPAGAKAPILNSKDAEIAGGVVGAGLLIWLLQSQPNQPTPASPVQP
jgi:hypothetical protein